MDIHEIVMRLIGPVNPVGDSCKDVVRLQNLNALTELVEALLDTIVDVAKSADRQEASMRSIGRHAREFLDGVRSQG